MGNIPIQIPERNFEIIRDAIGNILAFELPDQTVTANVSVWRDRSIPFEVKDLPAVNVSYDNSSYDNHNPKSKEALNQYYIDIHVNSKHTPANKGDELAAINCQRIAGIIDYILSSGEYFYLGFGPGLIFSRWVSDINIGKITQQDSLHSYVCRITFNVKANEEIGDLQGVAQQSISSQVKLNDTEKGHLFEIVAP